MATSKDYIAYIEEKLSHIPAIRTRAMFGEYALYCNNYVVALICDETFFLKITPNTTQILTKEKAELEQGPAYPGSKNHYIITERMLEEEALMKSLLQACAEDVAKTKKPKKKS